MKTTTNSPQTQPRPPRDAGTAAPPYVLRISRLIVDKLGVKLYDKASAVVAELIANGYDADAEEVVVSLPLGTLLAAKNERGAPQDLDFVVEVRDDGHGMTPAEARDYYLLVGRDRRLEPGGGRSRGKGRPVMGRKGIGKLAPFGICRRIEVISAGGAPTERGYQISHFTMDYDQILSASDKPIELAAGPEDGGFRPRPGTTIRLSAFLPKRVPDKETFHRQLAARFIFAKTDFRILVRDTRDLGRDTVEEVRPMSVPVDESTRIDLRSRPVRAEDGVNLPVSGWLAMAKESYKHEEAAGVRLYARDKIVATTRDFEQPAGFTGEFTVRSYLVGEVHAEWLDDDGGEDLIRSDRQGILWDSDYGRALRQWGAELIREIGAKSREPRQQRKHQKFLDKSGIVERAKQLYSQPEIARTAVELAGQLGGFADEDELEDPAYVDGLTEFVLSVAPHRALVEAFREFQAKVDGGDHSIEDLLELFGKTRVAEMASYCQLAVQRVRSVRELERIVHDANNVDESQYQEIIERAPWLIEPTWSIITKNQRLDTFKRAFAKFWRIRTGREVVFEIGHGTKRPDFTLVSVGRKLHVVEIKKGGHDFNDADYERMLNYVEAFTDFFADQKELVREFPDKWCIDLVADGVNLTNIANRTSFRSLVKEEIINLSNWNDFLVRAQNSHRMLLDINDEHTRTMFAAFEASPRLASMSPAKLAAGLPGKPVHSSHPTKTKSDGA